MPDNSNQLSSSIIERSVSFHPNASYLLVGGLGGLGRAVGARHLVFLSRNAGFAEDDKEFICELEAAGGSVASLADLQNAGVLQMSLCLKDGVLAGMSYEDCQASMAPKVQGTWNLHEAVAREDLDFFVLFSSGFSRYRRQLGLPSSVLVLGAVGEVGLISRQPKLLQSMLARGFWMRMRSEGLGDIFGPPSRPNIMLTEESRSLIIQETVRLISSSLIGSQDLDEGQKWGMPIDSLASLEIKSWVRRNMNIDVSVAEFAESQTVGGLELMTADRMVAHYKA
ncbi:KR-domain-containing protein [Aspergillus eucalypticola CBS 122712]|uniref:KR-domain-containing protein n=1 Tax=Aspergillus eucalypticola (strain CBS 122712 / IBT 29274) TaxID=1448314 RepID=A0A317V9I6_ASPEC|nr:KR-domain-containing protein [Aspergillus eucalypticola CBS 122712]PWY69921.1 KR-domain-containing protein [Aspergillus eucalypticola CBS 122712]